MSKPSTIKACHDGGKTGLCGWIAPGIGKTNAKHVRCADCGKLITEPRGAVAFWCKKHKHLRWVCARDPGAAVPPNLTP